MKTLANAAAKIAVIGGGVVGRLTAFFALQSKQVAKVYLIDANKQNKPDGDLQIVSQIAGASLIPHAKSSVLSSTSLSDPRSKLANGKRNGNGNQSDVSYESWFSESIRFYSSLSVKGLDGEYGVRWCRGKEYTKDLNPWWADSVRDYHVDEDRSMAIYTTLLVDPPRFLAYIDRVMDQDPRLQRLGLTVTHKEWNSQDFYDSLGAGRVDCVVNCAGAYGPYLAGDDENRMNLVRGNLLLVKAPWIQEWSRDATRPGRPTYIYPRASECVLGGTYVTESPSSDPKFGTCVAAYVPEDVKNDILERCIALEPSLENCRVEKMYTGWRPVREGGLRLQWGETSGGNLIRSLHQYGHGGEGYCYAPGTAKQAVEMILSAL